MEHFPHKISVAVFVAALMPGPMLNISTINQEDQVEGGLPSLFLTRLRITCGCKIMSRNEDDVKNDSDNDLGDDFDYQPNAEDDGEDDDVDSLNFTSKSEQGCGVKRIADLMVMVEDIWNLEFRTEDEACQFYNAYACWHGFVMRKDDVVRDNQGRIICRQLVCNKEGWRNMRYLDLDDRSREARSLMRTKCPA
ncbi:hypothetical protein AHAS_Ahas20G0153400 [Arachis hypogaea]